MKLGQFSLRKSRAVLHDLDKGVASPESHSGDVQKSIAVAQDRPLPSAFPLLGSQKSSKKASAVVHGRVLLVVG